MRREPQQASSPRLTGLTPEERKRACAGSDRYSSGEASARPIRKSGRGATLRGPQGARTTHRGHTLTHDGRDRLAGIGGHEPDHGRIGRNYFMNYRADSDISFGRLNFITEHSKHVPVLCPGSPRCLFTGKKTAGTNMYTVPVSPGARGPSRARRVRRVRACGR